MKYFDSKIRLPTGLCDSADHI